MQYLLIRLIYFEMNLNPQFILIDNTIALIAAFRF